VKLIKMRMGELRPDDQFVTCLTGRDGLVLQRDGAQGFEVTLSGFKPGQQYEDKTLHVEVLVMLAPSPSREFRLSRVTPHNRRVAR
jgi:hypothetical protein